MMDKIQEYQNKGLLKKEDIGFDQVVKNIRRAQEELKATRANFEIDRAVSFNCAYQAMLRTGRALMFSYGYRPDDGQQHKTVVVFAERILGEDFSDLVRRFDRMRQKRNKFVYDEPDLIVSEDEIKQVFETAQEFVQRVADFIQKNNPQKQLF